MRQHSAVLNNAILGKYKYASEMKQDFLQSLYPKTSRKPLPQQDSLLQTISRKKRGCRLKRRAK
ncbi:hypothetical protein MGI18_01305 [Bacillus sp. OVS6]|nr:hypothetical protein MGI18_01305 [Bacillus sp. OVS6]